MNTDYPAQSARSNRPIDRLLRVTGGLGDVVGYLSAILLAILVCSITLGIAMRVLSFDNSWTYDVDLFALIWVAFVGAAFTAVRDHHVTSGLSPVMIFPRSKTLFTYVRFIVIAVFLALFTISGFAQFLNSVQSHETTLDVMSWPVWIATLALPVGTLLWLLAELHLLLRRLTERNT